MSKLKFQFNWGWAMLLVFLTFMSTFLYLFYKSMQYAKNYDLVVDDYYTAELQYGEELKKIHAADTMRIPVRIIEDSAGVEVVFPPYIPPTRVKGTVTLFKPDNKKLDQTLDLRLDTAGRMHISKEKFTFGRWDVILRWQIDSTEYVKKEKLYIR
ncbi:MAG: hypothetical protein GXO27_07460 [Chlorobi bacterium]|nr:hypothetical protein [Chlorobiota bacterium]